MGREKRKSNTAGEQEESLRSNSSGDGLAFEGTSAGEAGEDRGSGDTDKASILDSPPIAFAAFCVSCLKDCTWLDKAHSKHSVISKADYQRSTLKP
jgi:hypothetical protein